MNTEYSIQYLILIQRVIQHQAYGYTETARNQRIPDKMVPDQNMPPTVPIAMDPISDAPLLSLPVALLESHLIAATSPIPKK